tara:strand:+ start:290 stop:583 length:294 start_codon:yes stop_codon:yes gene_type:complete
MLQFKYTTPEDMLEYSDVADVEFKVNEDATLPELVAAFDKFVRAIGYMPSPNATLEYVEEHEFDETDTELLWSSLDVERPVEGWPNQDGSKRGRNYD